MVLNELLEYATRHGIEVVRHDITVCSQKGLWLPRIRTISLLDGMGEINTCCTLAHELGHFSRGHSSCGGRDELQADRWAAQRLISDLEFRLAAEMCDDHPGAIAEALGVTRHMVEVYWQMRQCRGRQALAG